MVHGYLYGIYSSRKREEACQYRLDFKCLAEDLFYQFGKKREEMNETDHQTVCIATATWSICNRRMVPLRVPAARHAAGQKNNQPREVVLQRTFWEKRGQATRNISSERGIHLRLRRSIQVEGAFALLKNDFGFPAFSPGV